MKNDHHLVLRVVAKAVIPLVLIFAFYVQWHGKYSAGGGFQAGVLVAVAVILYALIYGMEATRRAVPPWFVRTGAALGVLLYGAVGVFAMLSGGDFLDFDYVHPDYEHRKGQYFGILFVEIGVLITVASTMVVIFYAFASRAAAVLDEES